MALKAPGYQPMSPFPGYKVYLDPTPANAVFPGATDANQHALATAGHHYGGTLGCQLTAGTHYLFCPVPPSVVYVQVVILMQGNGTVTLNSTNTTTAKTWTTSGKIDSVNATYPLKTSGLPGDSITSPLKVRSSAAWTWTSELVTLTLTGYNPKIHAIGFEPVWSAQST